MAAVDVGMMVFLTEGKEGIGAVRDVSKEGFTLYIENGGEFSIPLSAVTKVHDGKVLVDPKIVDKRLLDAVKHAHDAEDPNLVG